jgi:tRNA threonylcarbamoyladenosine biosynthesis protein TsaB
MAYLLALETSTTICSVALFKDDQLLGISELQIEKSHSSHITVLIEQLLQNCKVAYSQLSAVALSGGPGSYTGLRIGSSTAKGLCFSLDIPLIAISTLKALTVSAIEHTPPTANYLFCPMLDARRMEVYAALFNNKLEEIMSVRPVILEETSFQEYLNENQILFLGSGAAKLKPLIPTKTSALFLDSVLPSARTMGKLALNKFNNNIFEDVAYYEPFYLKEVYITSSTKQK